MAPLAHGLLSVPAEDDRRFEGLSRKLRLLAMRELLTTPLRELSEPVRRALPALRVALEAAARRSPARAIAAVGQPDVLAPVLCASAGLTHADGQLRAAAPSLLAALAAERGALEESALWDVPIACLPRVDRGVLLRFDPPARGLLADASGVEIRLGGGARVPLERIDERTPEVTIEPAFHALHGATAAHLALHDANPLAMHEEHPDKRGNAIDLGGREPAEWTRALSDALELVRAALPTVHAELGRTLQRIVPVGYEPERHLSASYREAPGLVYLTLHPSLLTLAEAIVHETQHGKLNVLSFFDPALRNGRTTWTPSPVRPDLRPLSGVLLAVHAFVPVAALHQRLAELSHPIAGTREFAMRRAQVVAGNERGLAIVRELGDPTPLGREIIDALERLHAQTRDALPADGPSAPPDALPPG